MILKVFSNLYDSVILLAPQPLPHHWGSTLARGPGLRHGLTSPPAVGGEGKSAGAALQRGQRVEIPGAQRRVVSPHAHNIEEFLQRSQSKLVSHGGALQRAADTKFRPTCR
ncbi:hypothetical protein QYF61_013300 [Mycteria americana]|uniref:Uncharacterized protein n=1 Tax=Mycteria americana TaxID=33587 RepID=A0AAN7N938_MYCAM|nr:hypothetical protein QYF61_013300 [Mycteria americana]